MLKPKFALLDEIDSGLDVDALRIVGENVNQMKSEEFGSLVITHYERLLDYLDIDKVHIFMQGRVITSGGKELITKIDNEGYDWVKDEYNLEEEVEVSKAGIIGTCAVKDSLGGKNE